MTTTLAFALRPALPSDVDFEHYLYASTRDDLRPLGPEVFDGLVGMQFRAQTMSIRLDHPQADHKIVVVEDAPAGRLIVEGLTSRDAARAAIAGPLTDDASVGRGLTEMIEVYLGDADSTR